MTREFDGAGSGAGLKIGIVVSSFNSFITDKLLEGTLKALRENEVAEADITIVRVPGSFEIPIASKKLISSGDYDALVGLGSIIKGETAHFDVLSTEVTRSISNLSQASDIPICFGVITALNSDQALNRAGGDNGNRGYEAGLAAVHMGILSKKLDT